MGLIKEYLDYIEECMSATVGDFRGKKMLELGNQEIMWSEAPERTGKEYYANRGFEHTSVDINGLDGALPLNLTEPRHFERWKGSFDVLTNSGTTEHVEPLSGQYECFSIIHDCLTVGGISIHLVPDIDELRAGGRWQGHCFNYYSRSFFYMLAAENDYRLVSLKIINSLVCCCLQKRNDQPFTPKREEFLKLIARVP